MSNDKNQDPAADAFESYCKDQWEQNCMLRQLSSDAIQRNLKAIDALQMHTNKRVWEIDNKCLASWCSYLTGERKLKAATVHTYQLAVCRFSEYLRHQKDLQSQARAEFSGSFPTLSPVALPARERHPERRPEALSREQIDQLFQYLADRIRWAQSEAPHEVDCLRRDRVMYLLVYAYSLRAVECVALNTTSWRHVVSLPEFGQWGELMVSGSVRRHGDRCERTVVTTLPSVPVLMHWYLTEVHPAFHVARDRVGHPLFAHANGQRISTQVVHARFKEHLRGAGLDSSQLTLGCLRWAAIDHECQRSSVDFVLSRLGHNHNSKQTTRILNTYIPRELIVGLVQPNGDQAFDSVVGPALGAITPRNR